MRRRRIDPLPCDQAVIVEADRLRRRHRTLNAFDANPLATAKLAGEMILPSDTLFPMLDEVPVISIPRV